MELTAEESTSPVEPVANTSADPLREEIEVLKARVAALESVAHNTHSIPTETIAEIVKQAVQKVGRHLRTTSDILSVLEQ